MYLASLGLTNFRNYRKKIFKFSENTTLFVGPNASGKTNILEAIFLLATGKSFRAQKIEEMIYFNEELSRVNCGVFRGDIAEGRGEEVQLEILLTRGQLQGKRVAKRRYSVDGVNKRSVDFIGRLVVVVFRPEDLQLVLGSPQRRREFLDGLLSQVDREYRRSLVSYEKALARRNKLLDAIRDEGVPRTQLTFWNQLLIKHGRVLSEKRATFIDFVNTVETEVNSFKLKYDSSAISQLRLNKYSEQEIAAGFTLVGPHKDDFEVFSKNKEERNLVSYGSRGEQRLAVLWLKLAELAFVTLELGETPVLLLDDIFSELDQERREMVLKVLPHQQTIMTTTDIHLVEFKYRKDFKTISLK